MLSAPKPKGDFYSLHFVRPGKWTIPLGSASAGAAAAASDAGFASATWEVRYLDYWDMTVTVLAKLPMGTANVSAGVVQM